MFHFQNQHPLKAKEIRILKSMEPYNTKQKPQGVFEFLSNPIMIFLISPAREKSS